MPRIVPFPTEDIQYPGVKEFARNARAPILRWRMANHGIEEARMTLPRAYHANRYTRIRGGTLSGR